MEFQLRLIDQPPQRSSCKTSATTSNLSHPPRAYRTYNDRTRNGPQHANQNVGHISRRLPVTLHPKLNRVHPLHALDGQSDGRP
jgi:hypothetical protein